MLWSAEGERARAYLHGRGLTDETLRARRIGFQPKEGRRDPPSAGASRRAPPAGSGPGYVSRAASSCPGCWMASSGN